MKIRIDPDIDEIATLQKAYLGKEVIVKYGVNRNKKRGIAESFNDAAIILRLGPSLVFAVPYRLHLDINLTDNAKSLEQKTNNF